jgi:hypothetical protein
LVRQEIRARDGAGYDAQGEVIGVASCHERVQVLIKVEGCWAFTIASRWNKFVRKHLDLRNMRV